MSLSSKRENLSKETLKKMRESHLGKRHSEEAKKKMSISHIGNQNALGYRHSEEAKKKISESHKGRKRKPLSKETKRKMSISHIGLKNSLGHRQSEEIKKKKSKIALKNWQNPEFAKRMIKSFDMKPTKPERRLRNGLNKMFPGEYKYVGDGKVWIVGKNPDFINVNGQKKIIEMFGNYWHSKEKTGRTKEQEENQRIAHFARYGFKTLIVWQEELKNTPQLKKKLRVFHREI